MHSRQPNTPIPPRYRTNKSRGLYEQDKLSFKLILALKILLTARRLEQSDVTLFIKGGAALDLNAVRPKPYLWLADPAWLNAIQLSRDNLLFKVNVRSVMHDRFRGHIIINNNNNNYSPTYTVVPRIS